MASLKTCPNCVFRISSARTKEPLEYFQVISETSHFTHRFKGKKCGKRTGGPTPQEEADKAEYPEIFKVNKCISILNDNYERCGQDGSNCSRSMLKRIFHLSRRCKSLVKKIDAESTLSIDCRLLSVIPEKQCMVRHWLYRRKNRCCKGWLDRTMEKCERSKREAFKIHRKLCYGNDPAQKEERVKICTKEVVRKALLCNRGEQQRCNIYEFWDQKKCSCVPRPYCRKSCPRGQFRHPEKICECVDNL